MAIETVSASPNAITERLPLRFSWALTGLAALAIGGSGAAKIAQAPTVVANFTEARLAGYLLPIGALELIVVVLLVISRTLSLGILLTIPSSLVRNGDAPGEGFRRTRHRARAQRSQRDVRADDDPATWRSDSRRDRGACGLTENPYPGTRTHRGRKAAGVLCPSCAHTGTSREGLPCFGCDAVR
jgi:hypothetical protein